MLQGISRLVTADLHILSRRHLRPTAVTMSATDAIFFWERVSALSGRNDPVGTEAAGLYASQAQYDDVFACQFEIIDRIVAQIPTYSCAEVEAKSSALPVALRVLRVLAQACNWCTFYDGHTWCDDLHITSQRNRISIEEALNSCDPGHYIGRFSCAQSEQHLLKFVMTIVWFRCAYPSNQDINAAYEILKRHVHGFRPLLCYAQRTSDWDKIMNRMMTDSDFLTAMVDADVLNIIPAVYIGVFTYNTVILRMRNRCDASAIDAHHALLKDIEYVRAHFHGGARSIMCEADTFEELLRKKSGLQTFVDLDLLELMPQHGYVTRKGHTNAIIVSYLAYEIQTRIHGFPERVPLTTFTKLCEQICALPYMEREWSCRRMECSKRYSELNGISYMMFIDPSHFEEYLHAFWRVMLATYSTRDLRQWFDLKVNSGCVAYHDLLSDVDNVHEVVFTSLGKCSEGCTTDMRAAHNAYVRDVLRGVAHTTGAVADYQARAASRLARRV